MGAKVGGAFGAKVDGAFGAKVDGAFGAKMVFKVGLFCAIVGIRLAVLGAMVVFEDGASILLKSIVFGSVI